MGEGAIVQMGVTLRNMGPESTVQTMRDCAVMAESAGMESLWITDHIAIPPDDAEGSGGRYVDPLTTLAWMAGFTTRIRLGVGVMVVPYRPALPFAKAVAAVQELSNERLLLGVGVGWMAAEFKALGVPRRERGRRTDATLDFLNRCFADDVVTENGQSFLFKPRPRKPPVLVGGRAPHALARAAQYGEGWLPMGGKPADLEAPIRTYHELTAERGRPRGQVTSMVGLELSDVGAAREAIAAYASVGVSRLVCGMRYTDVPTYRKRIEALAQLL